jgi:uncharacterized membrane protein YdjX (TVP38/TMEM64 family)
MEKKTTKLVLKFFWIILTFVPIILIILGYIYPNVFFSNQESIRDFVEGYGILAPIAFIFLQIIQVILTPLSHYVVSIAGGYIFGTFYGTLFNGIGRAIGSIVAFYIGRVLGRKIVEKFVSKKTIKKYDNLLDNKNSSIILLLIYLLPLFPDDEITYLVGISKIRKRYFLPSMILGHFIGSFALAYVGSGTSLNDPVFWTLISIAIVCFSLFFYLIRKK